MDYFWRGFEKRALLWRKGKDAEKFLDLSSRLTKNRAKQMGVTIRAAPEYKPPGLIQRAVNRMLGMKELNKKLSPEEIKRLEKDISGMVGAHTSLEKTVVVPDKMVSAFSRQKVHPGARPTIVQHELDEVDIAKKMGITPGKLKRQAEWDKLKGWGKAIKTRSFDPIADLLKPKPIGRKGYASHISPEVLLRESNRVFHETPTGVSSSMKNLRLESGELGDLKRRGLRYGDEYIPEGGRRWNKLVKALEGKLPTPPK